MVILSEKGATVAVHRESYIQQCLLWPHEPRLSLDIPVEFFAFLASIMFEAYREALLLAKDNDSFFELIYSLHLLWQSDHAER